MGIALFPLICALPSAARADLVVWTTLGPIEGRSTEAYDQSTVNQYFGIPFAAPPVGDLRFAAPTAHTGWNDTRTVTEHGGCCVQAGSAARADSSVAAVQGKEDCLVLDVYAPPPGSAPRQVLVWFYGGSFLEGCINLYDGTNLAAATGAVVVMINYRLSALGYLGLPEQLADGSTNVGLRDMEFGLQWVQANAAAFGGDSKRVAIFGQSAGAAAVLFQLVMPQAASLFHAAILQSPGGKKDWVQDLKDADNDMLTKEEVVNKSLALAETHGCTEEADRLACMRKLSVEKILAEPYGRFAPGIDGELIADNPRTLVLAGRWAKMPVIIGGTSCESCAGQGMYVQPGPPRNISEAEYKEALDQTFDDSRSPAELTPEGVAGWYMDYAASRGYWQALTRIASDNGHACNAWLLTAAFSATSAPYPVYRYEFRAAARSKQAGKMYPGAVHASELQYIFREPSPYEGSTLTPEQDAIALQMQGYWGALAAKGQLDPDAWPACTPGAHPCDHVMIFDTPHTTIDTEATVDDGSSAVQCGHWEEYM